MRKICYVTGSRADFGLIKSTLLKIKQNPKLEINLCVTGQHLLPDYGNTLEEIESCNLNIIAKINVSLDGSSGKVMSDAMAYELLGMTEVFQKNQPDLIMILGDRSEMLAAALAATFLNIPIIHLHGGERSGNIDDHFRHAISKLSHYHFVASEKAKEYLIGIGESKKRIFVTGAPGLDNLTNMKFPSRIDMARHWGFDHNMPIALMLFHPLVQEEDKNAKQATFIIDALHKTNVQVLCLDPNSDSGGADIKNVIRKYINTKAFRIVKHLKRSDFLAWLATADFLIGNSSSGIIEAATFGLPVLNVGCRQKNRERNENVIDTNASIKELVASIRLALKIGRRELKNVYGDGNTGKRIVKLLATLPLTKTILSK